VNALFTKFDGAGFALALIIHVSALLYVYWAPPMKTRKVTTIEVEVRKPKPPPPPEPPPAKLPEPEPPKPPEPPKKLVQRQPKPQEAPKVTKPPPAEPPKEPPKPVFGIDPSQTGGEGISVPVGNTTLADPSKRPKVTTVPPLPPPTEGVPTGKTYNPVAEEELKKLPENDSEDCGLAMKQKWSESETYANGVTGDVILRIELDERGAARSIKKIKGINAEIDGIATGFMKFHPKCRFKPAIGKDGKPAAFVIDRYVVHFERE